MYKLKTPISGNKMVTIENVVIILIIIALHCKLGDLISDKKMKAQQQNLKKNFTITSGGLIKKLNTWLNSYSTVSEWEQETHPEMR